jgi:LacI family transcriptional regulator
MPTAIVAGNNVLALHVIRLLRSGGIRVPEQVSVACFDDFGPFAGADPFVTVAAQQAYQFGHTGMRLLIERIRARGEDRPRKRIVLPTALILRKSTAPPMGGSAGN